MYDTQRTLLRRKQAQGSRNMLRIVDSFSNTLVTNLLLDHYTPLPKAHLQRSSKLSRATPVTSTPQAL